MVVETLNASGMVRNWRLARAIVSPRVGSGHNCWSSEINLLIDASAGTALILTYSSPRSVRRRVARTSGVCFLAMITPRRLVPFIGLSERQPARSRCLLTLNGLEQHVKVHVGRDLPVVHLGKIQEVLHFVGGLCG